MKQTVSLIPEPHYIKYYDGEFLPENIGEIHLSFTEADDRLVAAVKKLFHGNIRLHSSASGFGMSIGNLDKPQLSNEEFLQKYDSYFIFARSNGVFLFSETARGFFYGIKTLEQLLANHQNLPSMDIVDCADVKIRAMHFDLRQLYPEFENMLQYIEMFASVKVNSLLVEYEDKFPFAELKELKHPEYFLDNDQLKRIKQAAYDNFIDIIPLQQTFGHLEYILKHDRYKSLRETEEAAGELCPSKDSSLALVKKLLDEIITAHPESRFIHLGCDEVWSLCKCETCKANFGESKEKAFIRYVNRVIDYAAEKGKIPIIWHDMLSKCSDDELALLDKRAWVAIWAYNGNIENWVLSFVKRLEKNGNKIVAVPSVRCYDRTEDQNYPNVENRIQNLLNWAEILQRAAMDMVIVSNWATVFGLGCPYGIFETSIYTLFFAADKCWNHKSCSENYYKRYLKIFHRIEDSELDKNAVCNDSIQSYYINAAALSNISNKNRNILKHIALVREYEKYSIWFDCSCKYLFRAGLKERFSQELPLLFKRLEANYKALVTIKAEFEASLKQYLPGRMTEEYILSRFYQLEMIYKHYKYCITSDVEVTGNG